MTIDTSDLFAPRAPMQKIGGAWAHQFEQTWGQITEAALERSPATALAMAKRASMGGPGDRMAAKLAAQLLTDDYWRGWFDHVSLRAKTATQKLTHRKLAVSLVSTPGRYLQGAQSATADIAENDPRELIRDWPARMS